MLHPCAHAHVSVFEVPSVQGSLGLLGGPAPPGHVSHWLLIKVDEGNRGGPHWAAPWRASMAPHCFSQACCGERGGEISHSPFAAASAIKHPATHDGVCQPLFGCPFESTSKQGKPAALHAVWHLVTSGGNDTRCVAVGALRRRGNQLFAGGTDGSTGLG